MSTSFPGVDLGAGRAVVVARRRPHPATWMGAVAIVISIAVAVALGLSQTGFEMLTRLHA